MMLRVLPTMRTIAIRTASKGLFIATSLLLYSEAVQLKYNFKISTITFQPNAITITPATESHKAFVASL
jgi:hypothetical protein